MSTPTITNNGAICTRCTHHIATRASLIDGEYHYICNACLTPDEREAFESAQPFDRKAYEAEYHL